MLSLALSANNSISITANSIASTIVTNSTATTIAFTSDIAATADALAFGQWLGQHSEAVQWMYHL